MPVGVTTTTSAAPKLPTGVVIVIDVDVTAVIVAAAPPMVTELAPSNPEPVIVTGVPPNVDP